MNTVISPAKNYIFFYKTCFTAT